MAKLYAHLVVGLRLLLILGWAGAVVAALELLPPLPSSGALPDLIPAGSAAARADADAARLFGYPLEDGIAIVQRNPSGLPSAAVERAARAALDYDRRATIGGLRAVVPVPNGGGVPPAITALPGGAVGLLAGVHQHTSTIVTYLAFRSGTTLAEQVADAGTYARRYLTYVVGVTGPVAAQYEQGLIIDRNLGWVELFTVLAIAVIVGVRFRSVGAPAAALACAGAAYLLAVRIVAWGAGRAGVPLPVDADPVLVVLLLGVTTDYCVFFLAGMRSRVAEGVPTVRAARDATAESAPIVFAAGLIVAAGTGALVVARGGLLRALGPALAATVLVAMVVSMTLMPALLAFFGGVMFRGARPRAAETGAARAAAAKPVALILVAACVAGLGVAGAYARGLGLGSPLIGEMPQSTDVARAGAAAAEGFAPGILAPTDVLVIGTDAGPRSAAVSRLEAVLRRQPGVAFEVGPSVVPAPSPNPMAVRGALRFALVYNSDPLDATAIGEVRMLRTRLDALGRAAGLSGVRYEVGGQTALTADAINATASDLWRVGLAIAAVTMLLLVIFLRALLAPLYLLAASLLAVLATLGLTAIICDAAFGSRHLVYFVPFAAGVLLVSLGSDYNVFVVGRIWEEARSLPVRDAVAVAAPRASRAITTAGIALAASFGLLAVIPLEQFRQMAIIMGVGVTVDAIIVRSLLVPGLVALFGRAGMWPGRAGGTPMRSMRSTRRMTSIGSMRSRLPPTTRERARR